MLSTVVIGADEELSGKLNTVFQDTGRIGMVRAIDSYPERMVLERLLRAHAPQLVFLCVDDLKSALAVRSAVEEVLPNLPVVAFGRNVTQQVLLELMKVGVREFMPMPYEQHQMYELADRIDEQLSKNPLNFDSTDLMFSFLPAKPGVGTSTLALNLAVAMAKQTKTLLADFDLNSGLIAFMLKLNGSYTLLDAAAKSAELDENLWPQLVSKANNLDVLPSGRSEPGTRIDPAQIRRLVSFARRHYGAICVDLSGNLEKYSIELMQESKRIFLVTTPEIPPLHLARDRYQFLRNIDLGDRVSVLLNRHHRRSTINAEQIKDLLGIPVYETFPNHYLGVHQSLVDGKPVESSTELGRCINKVATRLLNPDASSGSSQKKSFIEHFSVLPAKYSAR